MSSRLVSSTIHHEQQVSLLCGIHAVNSLLQNEYGDHFTQRDFDGICLMLDPPRCCHVNQHRAWSGLGDYDLNVILYALSTRGLDGTFHDSRQSISRVSLEGVVGLLVNGAGEIRSINAFGSGNHWYTIRLVGSTWWDLNSLNRGPRRFLDTGEMLNDVSRVLDRGGTCIIIKSLTNNSRIDTSIISSASGSLNKSTQQLDVLNKPIDRKRDIALDNSILKSPRLSDRTQRMDKGIGATSLKTPSHSTTKFTVSQPVSLTTRR